LLEEFKKKVAAFDEQKIDMQYDTTFNLTGYYLSILSFVKPFLLNKTTKAHLFIPLGVLFHEKKYQKCNEDFWRYVSEILPELGVKAFIVTDCEVGIRNVYRLRFT
jgi:hypothetical protein